MARKSKTTFTCQICRQLRPASDVMPAGMVRPGVLEIILQEHPDWSPDGHICAKDLNHYRTRYVERILETERGELTHLEDDVVRSLREHELLAANINEEFAEQATLGDRLADRLAAFGGSWTFLSLFGGAMAVWVVVNTVVLVWRPFDPYPFILLNLMLSCLAAVQAPVIMMSQNRQEAKDRLRAEHDYRINLKAELEIRHLHSKLDLLLTHQWQRLLEIQEIQLEVMEHLGQAQKNR